MKKVVLVAGGAGFIGSHLCEYLLSLGHKVICADNCITGSLDNIKAIKDDIEFVDCDITTSDVFGLSTRPKIHEIYHLASIASPKFYVKYPMETMKVNTTGTENLLGVAKTHKAKILYTSTSEVYGDPLEHPQKEEYFGNVNPIGVRSVYDESKRLGETFMSAYARTYKVDAKIVRLFNCFGPRMAAGDGRVIPAFVNQALSGKDLTVMGPGTQTRSFCYVTDTVRALVAMMDSNSQGPINIGNPNEYYSVLDLAKIIMKLVPGKSKIKHIDFLTADDPKVRQPDITKAKKELNWEPIIGLKEGLLSIIEYYKRGIK